MKYTVFGEGEQTNSFAHALEIARRYARRGSCGVQIYRDNWIYCGGSIKNGRIYWDLWKGLDRQKTEG